MSRTGVLGISIALLGVGAGCLAIWLTRVSPEQSAPSASTPSARLTKSFAPQPRENQPAATGAGWTDFPDPASYGGKTIYVASDGLDTNSGLTPDEPKYTIDAAYALLTDGVGDHLLLRRGDTFTRTLAWKLTKGGNLTAGRYQRIGAYGDESLPRPIVRFLNSPGFTGASVIDTPRGCIAITDLDIGADNPPPSNAAIYFQNYTQILIEGNRIAANPDPWPDNIVVQTHGGGGSGETPTAFRIKGLKIRRNVIADSTNPGGVPPNFRSQGVYLDNCDNWLIEENIADHNGHHPFPTTNTGRNYYIHQHCSMGTYRNNIGARGGDADIQIRPGGLHFNNLALLNPYGVTIGAKGGDIDIHVIGNVVLYGNNISREHPRGTGALVHDGDRGAKVTHNIFAFNTLGTGDSNAGCLDMRTGGEIAHNLFYDWPRPGADNGYCVFLSESAKPLHFHHNTLFQREGGKQLMIDVAGPWTLNLIKANDNRYNWDKKSRQPPFRPSNKAEWVAGVGESGSSMNTEAIPDPRIRLGEVLTEVLGGEWSTDPETVVGQFMTKAREQRRGRWDDRLMPYNLNREFRRRAGIEEPGQP